MLADSLPDTYGRALFDRWLALTGRTSSNPIETLSSSANGVWAHGGQRAKAIIAYNKVTGEVRSGQVEAPQGFDHYLIKLDGVSATAGFRETGNYGRLEYSFYELAKECGVPQTIVDRIKGNLLL